MFNITDYEILERNQKTLRELSRDTNDKGGSFYMTGSDMLAVDFDKVKEIYERKNGTSGQNASSVDALIYEGDNIYFVEFKNGDMKTQKAKVKEKLRDSLLIFGDITHRNISFTRQNSEFVLVYNEEKNPLPNQYTKGMVSNSSSRIKIAKHIAQKANTEFILYIFSFCSKM